MPASDEPMGLRGSKRKKDVSRKPTNDGKLFRKMQRFGRPRVSGMASFREWAIGVPDQ